MQDESEREKRVFERIENLLGEVNIQKLFFNEAYANLMQMNARLEKENHKLRVTFSRNFAVIVALVFINIQLAFALFVRNGNTIIAIPAVALAVMFAVHFGREWAVKVIIWNRRRHYEREE